MARSRLRFDASLALRQLVGIGIKRWNPTQAPAPVQAETLLLQACSVAGSHTPSPTARTAMTLARPRASVSLGIHAILIANVAAEVTVGIDTHESNARFIASNRWMPRCHDPTQMAAGKWHKAAVESPSPVYQVHRPL
eukprot:scaffold1042_cov401-Prasinococcus_capsulatus_cf.AAC.52